MHKHSIAKLTISLPLAALAGLLKKWDAGMPLVRSTGAPVEMPDELL